MLHWYSLLPLFKVELNAGKPNSEILVLTKSSNHSSAYNGLSLYTSPIPTQEGEINPGGYFGLVTFLSH